MNQIYEEMRKQVCTTCGQRIRKPRTSTTIDPLAQFKSSHPEIANIVESQPDLPICVQLYHSGFWITDKDGSHVSTKDQSCNRNSVMLKPDCLLYVYKLALRHLLLTLRVITPEDIDAANLVAHVVVRKNPRDPFSKYNTVQDEQFILDETSLSSKTDFLIAELDRKRDLHMTMIYAKKLGKEINLVEAFRFVIQLLNARPELIDQYMDLTYFGEREIRYWYKTPENYPFNIACICDYIPSPPPSRKVVVTTAAGSIVS